MFAAWRSVSFMDLTCGEFFFPSGIDGLTVGAVLGAGVDMHRGPS